MGRGSVTVSTKEPDVTEKIRMHHADVQVRVSANITMVFRPYPFTKKGSISVKNRSPGANQIDIRVLLQIFHLTFKTPGICNIVTVHSSEVRSAARGDRLIQSLREPELLTIGIDPD